MNNNALKTIGINCNNLIEIYKKKYPNLYIQIKIALQNNHEITCSISENETESNFKNEFNSIKNIINFTTKLILDQKEAIFICNSLNDLDKNIQSSINSFESIPMDEDIVIPNSENIKEYCEQIHCENINILEEIEMFKQILINKYKEFLSNFNGSFEFSITESCIMILNSKGFVYEKKSKYGNLGFEISTDYNKNKFSYFNSYFLKDLCYKDIAEEIFKFLKLSIQNTQIKSGTYDCVFSNNYSCFLISSIISLLDGYLINNKSSCYFDKLNSQILSSNISIIDNPLSEEGFIDTYDYEGTKTKEKILIEKGILKHFLLSSRFAKKFNELPSGNVFSFSNNCEFSNLFINSVNPIKQITSNYILINQIVSDNLNSITGDFKASCSGVLYENNKEIPFHNAVIGFNLSDLINMNLLDEDQKYDFNSAIKTSRVFIPNIKLS